MKNNRGVAHLYILLAVLVVVVIFVVGKNFNKNGGLNLSFIRGDSTVPDDKPDKGLVYKGLQRDKDKCKNGFKFSVNGNDKCTHGPDEVPSTMNFAQIVAPGSGNTNGVTTTTVTCDGDGASGNRFQVIYAHGSDIASKYDTYLTSFQTWISGADADYANSAIRSGGSAIHPRFVHDSTCHPVIDNVTLPGTGSITMGDMESQLMNLGYNRSDRKYIVFMDNTTYCGIADIGYDDTLTSNNFNNNGSTFARTDNTCWSDYVAAHESMHTIGAVQLTAPHSALEFHSWDTYDIMSRPTNGTPTQFICTNTADAYMFDCNHDDYFSANVTDSNNYLSSHWNTASSKFMINPYPIPAKIDQLQTYSKNGKNLVATDSFSLSNKSLVFKAHAVEGGGSVIASSGVSMTVVLLDPSSNVVGTVTGNTDSTGTYQGTLNFGSRTAGTWTVKITSASKNGVNYLTSTGSVTQHQITRK